MYIVQFSKLLCTVAIDDFHNPLSQINILVASTMMSLSDETMAA